MRRGRTIRFGALWAGIGLAAGTGCTHNHYYYTTPGAVVPAGTPCDPVPAGGAVISSARPVMNSPMLGAVCDEPPGGAVSTRGTPIVSNAGGPLNPAPAPIYSRPVGRPLRRGGLAWRGSNTESLATTRVEGAYDDESTFK
jgi:hypothetical protein